MIHFRYHIGTFKTVNLEMFMRTLFSRIFVNLMPRISKFLANKESA